MAFATLLCPNWVPCCPALCRAGVAIQATALAPYLPTTDFTPVLACASAGGAGGGAEFRACAPVALVGLRGCTALRALL